MKKTVSLIFSFIMVFMLASCSGGAHREESLYNRGLDLIGEIHTLSKSDSYLSTMLNSSESQQKIKTLRDGNYTLPEKVFVISGAEEIMLKNLTDASEMEDDVKKILKGRMGPVIPSQLNAANGVLDLAASNVLAVEESFLNADIREPVIYYYKFNDKGFMTSFYPNSEGIVKASGFVIFNDDVNKLKEPQELSDYLASYLGLEGIKVDLLEN